MWILSFFYKPDRGLPGAAAVKTVKNIKIKYQISNIK
jgi:hypothetical protein